MAHFVVLVSVLATLSGAQVAAALEIGDRAPEFALPSTTGGTISLGQFRGRKAVLLEFYGADFAPQ